MIEFRLNLQGSLKIFNVSFNKLLKLRADIELFAKIIKGIRLY